MRYQFSIQQPKTLARARATISSVLVHGGVIALAVAATASPHGPRVGPSPYVEHVRYTVPLRYASATTTRSAGERSGAPARHARRSRPRAPLAALRLPDPSAISASIAALPTPPVLDIGVDQSRMARAGISFGGDGVLASLAFGVLGRYDRERMSGDAYLPWVVERSAKPRRGNPVPRYPRQLQFRGIEGNFLVRFVIDSTGRVDRSRIEFPAEMHRQFADAVRDALIHSRYDAARMGGHKVRQLVEQRFTFVLAR